MRGEPARGTEDVRRRPEARVVVDAGVVDDEAAVGGEEGGVGVGVERGRGGDGEDDGVDAEDFVFLGWVGLVGSEERGGGGV